MPQPVTSLPQALQPPTVNAVTSLVDPIIQDGVLQGAWLTTHDTDDAYLEDEVIQGVWSAIHMLTLIELEHHTVSSHLIGYKHSGLHCSFILDSRTIVHVCNDHDWFFDFTDCQSWISHGDSGSWIQGYGSVWLQVIAPDGSPLLLQLSRVAYCPNFHLNIVSFC